MLGSKSSPWYYLVFFKHVWSDITWYFGDRYWDTAWKNVGISWKHFNIFIQNANRITKKKKVLIRFTVLTGCLITYFVMNAFVFPCSQALNRLQEACKVFPVFDPRRKHLKAYLALLCNKTRKAKSKLKKCFELSKSMGLELEAQWSLEHKACWFGSIHVSQHYDQKRMFVLPKRLGV